MNNFEFTWGKLPLAFSNGSTWVPFSAVLENVGIADGKNAGDKCDQAPAILREKLPGQDGRLRFIRVADLPEFCARFLSENGRLPENTRNNLRELQQAAAVYLGEAIKIGGDIVAPSPVFSPEMNGVVTLKQTIYPGQLPPTSRKNAGKNAGATTPNIPQINGADTRGWLEKAGATTGGFLESQMFAYCGMLALSLAMTALHVGSAQWVNPAAPLWTLWVMCGLIQIIILAVTVHGQRYGSGLYTGIVTGFMLYDVLMNAGNFFREYDPSQLFDRDGFLPSGLGIEWPARINAMLNLAVRLAQTFGYPLGMLFFATLVKRLHRK